MLLWSRPPAILWFLSHRWERNSPRRAKPSRRPQAAKSPCEERNRSIIAPSSAPVCALGHLPPRGKAIVVGRRNEVSHKVLCQAFFQESGKTLSSRDWDESVWFASWCHPISERPGRSLIDPVLRRGRRACLQARWWRRLWPGPSPWGPLNLGQKPVGPLSVRRYPGYSCAVVAVNADMLPYFPQKVKEMWKTYRAKGTRLGFMPMRQSRSPRAKPWMSSSAVATLVARGTECSSHRREIYMTLSSMSVSLG